MADFVLWIVVVLLLVWVIIRDRSIWPMIFGSGSIGATSIIDNVEFSWLPDDLIALYKKYSPAIIAKLKTEAKKAWTKQDTEQTEAYMKSIPDMITADNMKGTQNIPVSASTVPPTNGTSTYAMPPRSWFMVTH